MQFPSRAGLAATPVAVALTLVMAISASAQVATLASPDESPSPGIETVETELEFADREEAMLAFAECMRDSGIDMDDPVAGERGGPGRLIRGGAAGGFDEFSEEFAVAQESCGPILEAARPVTDPEEQQERLETELALAQCFRENGYPEYPDPVLDSDGRMQRGGQQLAELGIDRRSEAFQDTRITCADELGVEAFGPGGGPGRGGN